MSKKSTEEELQVVKVIHKGLVLLAEEQDDVGLPFRVSFALCLSYIDSFEKFKMWNELIIISRLVAEMFEKINEIEFPDEFLQPI